MSDSVDHIYYETIPWPLTVNPTSPYEGGYLREEAYLI